LSVDTGTAKERGHRRPVILNAAGEMTKKRGPGQTRRLTGTAWARVICDGGLIRRRRNLALLCYAPVTAELIHRPDCAAVLNLQARRFEAGQSSLR
jgi:hypothetical protein